MHKNVNETNQPTYNKMITLILMASIKIMLMMITIIKLMITPKEQRREKDERMKVRVTNQPTKECQPM